MELFTLQGKVEIDTNEVSKQLNEVVKSAESAGSRIGSSLTNAGSSISNLGMNITKGVVAVGTALTAGTVGVFKYAESVASSADEVDKMSQRLGLSREAYQKFDYVLSQSGVEITSFSTGMKSLLSNMDKVSEGNATASDNFKKLGVNVLDTNGKMRSQEEVLFDVVSAFQHMEDGAEKSRLAQELFGRQGQEILPLLNSEAGSMEELMQQAKDLGLVMSNETIDAGVKFTDTMDTLKRSLQATGLEIANVVLPYVQKMAEYVIAHMPEIKKAIGNVADAIKGLIEWVGKIYDKWNSLSDAQKKFIEICALVVVAIGPLLTVIGTLISTVGTVITVGTKLFSGISTIVSAIGGVLIPAITSISAPVLAIIAVIGALIAIGVLLYQNWDEICAWAKKLGESIKENWNNAKEAISNAWNNIKNSTHEATENIKNKVNDMVERNKERFEHMKERLTELTENIKNNLTEKWENIKTAIHEKSEAIKNNVTEKWESIKNTLHEKMENIKSHMTDGWDAIKNTVSEKVEGMFNKVKDTFENIKSHVQSAVNRLKEMFKFDWSLPKIKLPHFHISGKFSLDPLSVPSIGVEWYKNGGILTQPTAFGINPATGATMVGGEAGAEAILPIEKLKDYMEETSGAPEICSLLSTLVNQNKELNNKLDNLSLRVNEREFARLVRTV